MIDLDAIKARADCRTIADGRGVHIVDRHGDTWRARCWHPGNHNNGDRNPSMTIGAGGWRCYGCGAHGSAIDLVMDLDGLDLMDAARQLAGELGIDHTPAPPWRARRAHPARPTRPPPPAEEHTPDPMALEVWGAIWAELFFTPPTDQVRRWAEERGVSWQTASLASVRDPTTAAGAILDVLTSYSIDDHRRAHTVDGEGKPWLPLRAVVDVAKGRRAPGAGGALIPIWTPGPTPQPVGARFRVFDPRPLRNGRIIKTWAQPRGAYYAPLGLDALDQAQALADHEGQPFDVLLCEGETDWLAAQDAMRQLGRLSATLGHCAMARAWLPSWTRQIAAAPKLGRVLLLFDQGNGDPPTGEKRAGEIYLQLAEARGVDWAANNVLIHLTPEGGRDLADLHKAGDLAPLLNDLLGRQTITQNEAMEVQA